MTRSTSLAGEPAHHVVVVHAKEKRERASPPEAVLRRDGVGPARVDRLDRAQLAALDRLPRLVVARVEPEAVPHQERHARAARRLGDRLGVGHRGGDGLLDEDVTATAERQLARLPVERRPACTR